MAAITTSAIGIASTAYSVFSGEQQKAEAKEAIENLEVPKLENPFNDLRISSVGTDLIREEGQRRTASMLETIQGGGARSVFSALPKLVQMNDQINQEARKEIDKQMIEREYAAAGYEEKRNQYAENRYQNELAGYGNLYDKGQHQVWNGMRTGLTSLGEIGRAIDIKGANDDKKQ
ncbi:hypothetical protein [Tenacibaculum sp. 190524A02b]|uniref:hypothetical protein n=1 Tax=Tenacibaculum vairaonense TaxID=3137860 RepID=UPI0031FA6226